MIFFYKVYDEHVIYTNFWSFTFKLEAVVIALIKLKPGENKVDETLALSSDIFPSYDYNIFSCKKSVHTHRHTKRVCVSLYV